MNNEKLFESLAETARSLSYNLPVVKKPTKVTRIEYPYFKRLLRALFNKPTYYEVSEWISPVFNDTKGDEFN